MPEEKDLFGFEALIITPMDLAPALKEMTERLAVNDPNFINEAMSAWLYVRTGQHIKRRAQDG